jgi:protein pelota
MKILNKDTKHDTVTVLPEVLDDFWLLYNIIQKGDRIYAMTTREVRPGERYDRPEKGRRISVFLGVSVEKVMWDRHLNRLRVHGIICEAPEVIGAGSHHTLKVTLNKPLKIVKDRWTKYKLDQLKEATKREGQPIIVISIDDEGYCIAVLRGFGLDIKSEKNIILPGKRNEDERTRTLQNLFKSASKTLRDVRNNLHGPIVVLGLGFIKNQFVKYLEEKMPELRESVIDVKSVNSVGKAGITESLRSGILSKAFRHVRIAREAEVVEEVLKRLGKEWTNVTYGLADVERANTLGAVERLLLTDTQLREANDEERETLENLMRGVEKKRGRIIVISTEHEAGTKLNSLGGVAALLRFPMKQ